MLFEIVGSIRNPVPDVVGDSPKIIATFLLGKLGMADRAKE